MTDRRNPRMMTGGSLQQLMDMISGGARDEEHEKIVDTVAAHTTTQLRQIAGEDKMREQYIHDLWNGIMGALSKAEIETSKPGLTDILRIIADTLDMKQKMHRELHEKRAAQRVQDIKSVDKDLQ